MIKWMCVDNFFVFGKADDMTHFNTTLVKYILTTISGVNILVDLLPLNLHQARNGNIVLSQMDFLNLVFPKYSSRIGKFINIQLAF